MNQSPKSQTNSEWSEICQWLQSLNYVNYTSSFKNAGYDLWEIMIDLKVDDLTSIGIKPGHARRIEKQLSIRKAKKIKSHSAVHDGNVNNVKTKAKVNSNLNPNPIPIANPNPNPNANRNTNVAGITIKQEIIFAEKIKNQLFQTMTRVLNGLQQQLIEMNVKFAEPILALQRAIVAEKSKEHLNVMEDALLLEILHRRINELKRANDKLWNTVNQFRNLADSHINIATEQIQHHIHAFNRIKSKQNNNNNHKNNTNNNNNNNNNNRRPLLNTIIVNLDPKNNININNINNNNNNKVSAMHYNVPSIHTNPNTSVPPYTMGEIEMMKRSATKQQQGRLDIMELQHKMQSTSGYIRNPVDIVHKMNSMGLLASANAAISNKSAAVDHNKSKKKSQLLQSSIATIVPPPPSSSASPKAKNGPYARDYNADEIVFIRKLIAEHPNADTKSLFAKFRQHFNGWKDDKESYNIFYQNIWKLCEELIHRKRCLQTNPNHNLNCNEPKRKKLKLTHNVGNVLSLRQ